MKDRLKWKRFRLPNTYFGYLWGADCRGHRLHVAQRPSGRWFFMIDGKCPPSRRGEGFPDDGTTYRLARLARREAENWAVGHLEEPPT